MVIREHFLSSSQLGRASPMTRNPQQIALTFFSRDDTFIAIFFIDQRTCLSHYKEKMVVLIWAAIRANVSLDGGALLRHFPPHLKHLLGSFKAFWKYLEIWDSNIALRHIIECAAQEYFMLLFSSIDRILWGIYVLAGARNSVIGTLSINKAFSSFFFGIFTVRIFSIQECCVWISVRF